MRIRQILEGLYLKATKITCSIKRDQNWWRRNFILNLPISESVNYNDKRKHKDWHYRTHNTDMLNLDENNFVYKKNNLWKEKVLRDTQIRSMHEIGKMKRAQELRNEEVSVQKMKRKSWDNSTAHFPFAVNARIDEFHVWFRRISRCGIKLQWKIVIRFQSTCNDSEFSFHAEPRQASASEYMEFIWITGKRFW